MTKKFPTAEDSDLFRQAIGHVQKIKTDKIHIGNAAPKPYPKAKPLSGHEEWRRHDNSEIEQVSHEQTLIFTAPGLQKSVLTKLRKGFFGIQGNIDLHGLTAEAAQRELLNFIQDSLEKGYRCVHVIHGKGYGSNETQPVLKNQINRWLREHLAVQAFCSAPQRQGGAGAVLVLLKLKPA